MREKIYKIIEVDNEDNKYSHIYDTTMMFIICTSMIPLAFKNTNTVFLIIEYVTTAIFILDYLSSKL